MVLLKGDGENMNIINVWKNIKKYSGEEFYTKTGIPYSYTVKGSQVMLQNTNRNIPYSDFEKAVNLSNISISKLNELGVQGPSYIYGIITDERIKK